VLEALRFAFVLVVRYLFWLYDVCFGCAMRRLGFSFGVLPSHSLMFSSAVLSALCLFICSFSLVRHVYVVVARSVEILACLIKALSHRVVLVPCLTIHLLA